MEMMGGNTHSRWTVRFCTKFLRDQRSKRAAVFSLSSFKEQFLPLLIDSTRHLVGYLLEWEKELQRNKAICGNSQTENHTPVRRHNLIRHGVNVEGVRIQRTYQFMSTLSFNKREHVGPEIVRWSEKLNICASYNVHLPS